MRRPGRFERLRLVKAAVGRNEEALEHERRALMAAAARVAWRKWRLRRLSELRDRLSGVVDNAPST
jgi:hypothetical protein